MREILSIEEFRRIKEEIIKLAKEADEIYFRKTMSLEELNNLEDDYFNKIYQLEKRLEDYDLSDIPFEEWKDFYFITDSTHVLDLSSTGANIDFSLVNTDDYLGNINFKGCKIRNIGEIRNIANTDDFDSKTIVENSEHFLSDMFSDDFKSKYNIGELTLDDLASLNDSQLAELSEKGLLNIHRCKQYSHYIIDVYGLKTTIDLYNYSKEDYKKVDDFMRHAMLSDLTADDSFVVEGISVENIKDELYKFVRDKILYDKLYYSFDIQKDYFPKDFVNENKDIFLIDADIPEEVKERYFKKRLTFDDIVTYKEVFEKIPVDEFLTYTDSRMPSSIPEYIKSKYGYGEFQKILFKHKDLLQGLYDHGFGLSFTEAIMANLSNEPDIVTNFENVVVEYLHKNESSISNYLEQGNLPSWLSSLNLNVIDKIETYEDLLKVNDRSISTDYYANFILENINIDHLKRLEEETKLITKGLQRTDDNSLGQNFLYLLASLSDKYMFYKNMTYEEFENKIAELLDILREKRKITLGYFDYDWIEGDFRNRHPEIFISKDAPEDMRRKFYHGSISLDYIYANQNLIPYIINSNLSKTFSLKLTLHEKGFEIVDGPVNGFIPTASDFVEQYAKKYGNEKLMNLLLKYRCVMSQNISINSFNNELDDEKAIEEALMKGIYNTITRPTNRRIASYEDLANIKEFKDKYPDIFLSYDELSMIPEEKREKIIDSFYVGLFDIDLLKEYPELAEIMKKKDFYTSVRNLESTVNYGLSKKIGSEIFIDLYLKYGLLLKVIEEKDILTNDSELKSNYEQIIEDKITKCCLNVTLDFDDKNAPQFLKEQHPELFLDEDAPEELKTRFYNNGFNFNILSIYKKEWLPYLKGKSIRVAMMKSNYYLKERIGKYFDVFGEEKALDLGVKRAEHVMKMISSNKVELMKKWYDKTGGKFIPDCVVMINLPFEQADKFLTSGSNWSNLMKNKGFAASIDARDALFKLAYSFGVFDDDKRGIQLINELIGGLPKKIPSTYGNILHNVDSVIDSYTERYNYEDGFNGTNEELCDILINNIMKNDDFIDKSGLYNYINLLDILKKEKIDIDFSKPIISQLYNQKEDGSYVLTFNQQRYPKLTSAIRSIFNNENALPIITPETIHHNFDGLKLDYDPDFREFLVSNFEEIMESYEYRTKISNVQRNFKDIKAIYANVPKTPQLVFSYVSNFEYENQNVGNEMMAKSVADVKEIRGYSQKDFEVLQEIYNIGKQRVYSSIPRVEGDFGEYHYQILRLDDPLALTVGVLTTCCQRLNGVGCQCMEHSMVDKNGRLFYVCKKDGTPIAQSWVWRNRDVLCFDNIEVPDPQMWAHGIPRGHEDDGIRNEFTDEILEIYKIAAHQMMEKDEQVYKELLDSGKITEEQYEGLRLSLITTGEGYSNIKGSLQTLKRDKRMARPHSFIPPIDIGGYYYTDDSEAVQYIIDEREEARGKTEYNGDTIQAFNDEYIIHDKSNLTQTNLLTLNKLELVTKGNANELLTSIDFAYNNDIMDEIAYNYRSDEDNTRIIVHPNFAIIYELYGNDIKILDLLFNTKIDNGNQQIDITDKVAMQIRLAMDQIASGKEVYASFDEKQQEMYDKAMGLTEELDIERGVIHAK